MKSILFLSFFTLSINAEYLTVSTGTEYVEGYGASRWKLDANHLIVPVHNLDEDDPIPEVKFELTMEISTEQSYGQKYLDTLKECHKNENLIMYFVKQSERGLTDLFMRYVTDVDWNDNQLLIKTDLNEDYHRHLIFAISRGEGPQEEEEEEGYYDISRIYPYRMRMVCLSDEKSYWNSKPIYISTLPQYDERDTFFRFIFDNYRLALRLQYQLNMDPRKVFEEILESKVHPYLHSRAYEYAKEINEYLKQK